MVPRVNIPGFRPGRVPLAVVRERYRHSLQRETMQYLISNHVQQIMQAHKLDVIGYPHIDIGPSSVAGHVQFTVLFTLKPPIPNVDFSKIHLSCPTCKVTKSEVHAQLKSMAATKQQFLPRTGKAPKTQAEDRLTLDYHCRVEGQKKEWKENGITYTLGEKRSHPLEQELEKRLLGVKKGQKFSFPFTFPTDHPESKLAGKSAHFDITVQSITAVQKYGIDDDLARAFDCCDIADLKKKISLNLQTRMDGQIKQYLRSKLTVILAGLYDFALPQNLIDTECRNYIQTRMRKKDAKSPPPVLSEEQMIALREDVARRVRFGLIISHIGAKNNVNIDPKHVEDIIRSHMPHGDGDSDRQIAEYYAPGKEGRKKLEASLFEDKVLDFILSQAQLENQAMTAQEFTEADEKTQEEVQSLMAPLVGSGPARGPSASKSPWQKGDEEKKDDADAAKADAKVKSAKGAKTSKKTPVKAKATDHSSRKEPSLKEEESVKAKGSGKEEKKSSHTVASPKPTALKAPTVSKVAKKAATSVKKAGKKGDAGKKKAGAGKQSTASSRTSAPVSASASTSASAPVSTGASTRASGKTAKGGKSS